MIRPICASCCSSFDLQCSMSLTRRKLRHGNPVDAAVVPIERLMRVERRFAPSAMTPSVRYLIMRRGEVAYRFKYVDVFLWRSQSYCCVANRGRQRRQMWVRKTHAGYRAATAVVPPSKRKSPVGSTSHYGSCITGVEDRFRYFPERAAQAAPVECHALDECEYRHALRKPEPLDRVAGETGDEGLAAAIDADLDDRAVLGTDVGDDARQDVERAEVCGRRFCQHDIAGAHTQPEAGADRHIDPVQFPATGARGQLSQPVGLVVPTHCGLDDGAGLGTAGQGEEIEALHDLRRRPDCRDLSVGQQHNGCREAGHFGDGVADIDDGDLALVAEAFDVGQDLSLARIVEGGERLVHQQYPRIGKQRAANSDALLLAARKTTWAPIKELGDAEQIDHTIKLVATLGSWRKPAAIEQVPAHRQVREQAPLLEHVT